MSDRGDQTVRNPHIVVVDVGGYAGSAWMCEDCGQRGMSLQGGPGPTQLRYAREKHVCRRWDKDRGWCQPGHRPKGLGPKA